MHIIKLDINIQRQITLFGGTHPFYLDEESILLEELHEYIVRKKSIKGIEIEIPPMDFTSATIDLFNDGKQYKGCGGIYFLYGEDGGLLNIGSTDDLYVRIYQKLMGKNGGSKADFYFCNYYKGVSLFSENNHYKRKVYEPYLINKLQAPLNNQYNYYNKSLYYELLKKEEEASSPFFGYKSSYA
ncbi:GIY-YIG nuclease family protein [Neobacillus sp. 179-C4.2 HS]|uniref:GIY-YIG nuclease family protein n=1 Tax=Neobacillus driksii TaxID=3035913 RepID=A0ABV4YUI8_9BACI|nr:GIY-YIG nuclease family protein [Neobacillus sp. 179.-C4.2 HS]